MIVAVLLAASWAAAAEPPVSSPPAETIAVDPDRQATLVEMRERGILSRGSEYWHPEDQMLLRRMRRAEARGAFDLLREEIGSLRGLVVEHRASGGRKLWLTKRGFERFQFLRSQKARQYFEDQGVDARFVFKLKDPLGKRLFTPKGILTPEGEDLFERAELGMTVRWTDTAGKIVSSGSPKPSSDE